MRRPLFSALVLAACIFPVKAGTLESAAHLRAQPMHFTRTQEGQAEACGANCRVLVFASGMITADTPRHFEAFAREHDLAGATMAFDSDGGSVRGALALGRAIRDWDGASRVALIASGVVLLVPIRRFVDGESSDGAIPSRIRGLATLSLIVWTAVITTGRLIAYVG